MSSTEARQCFGDVIYATYFDGSDYVPCEFRYNKTFTQTPYDIDSASGSYTYQGDTWLEYKMYSSYGRPSMQPSEITFDIQPVYSIFDTTQIHTCICLSTQNDLSASVYQSPAWDWMYNGNTLHIENNDTTVNGDYHAMLMLDGYRYTYVCADLSAGSAVSGYSYRATFYGNSDSGSNPFNVYLELGLPYIDSSGSGGSGTFTAVSTTPQPSYTIIVDNSGVESRLDDVNSGIADINSAIYGQSGGTMPYLDSLENPEYHFDGSTIDDIDQTLRDVPAVISSAAWWWNLAFDVLHLDSAIWSLVPLLCILSLVSYMLWRW